MKSRLILLFILFFQGVVLVSEAAGDDTARIAVAANFIKPATRLKEEFLTRRAENLDSRTGPKQGEARKAIDLVVGSSGKLAALIERGAPFDAFFSADIDRPMALIGKGKAIRESLVVYARGRLVVWHRPRVWPCEPKAALARPNLPIAIANERLAPYGMAAVQTLLQMGIPSNLFVRADNVAQAYSYVRSGNAEIGFVAGSDVIDRKGHCLWWVPESFHDPIEQAAVQLSDNTLAADFIEFVMGADGQAIIAKSGYSAGRQWGTSGAAPVPSQRVRQQR